MNKNQILIRLSESDRLGYATPDFHRRFASQTLPRKVFSAIWDVEAEVNNGGFSLYFEAQSDTASFVVEALNAIGASRAANICLRAINTAFPSGLPPTQELVRNAAENLSPEIQEKLSALDQEFFKYPDDLTDLLFDYVLKHPEDFGVMPDPDDA